MQIVVFILKSEMNLQDQRQKGYIGSIATIAMLGLKLAVQNEKIEEKEKQDLEKRMLDTSGSDPRIS